MLDLIIIGASAAGVSAAIYAARRKLNFLIVSGDIGGEVLLSGEIENYPGFKHTDGVELTEKFTEQLDYYEVQREIGTLISDIQRDEARGCLVLKAKDESGKEKNFEARTVIIATGVKPRHLDVPGEKEFYLKGVTYCTVCDGPLFKGKVTATIGTGNSALESALMMAGIAKEHYVLTKHPEFKGDKILVDKLMAQPNVKVLWEAMTEEIVGEGKVTGVKYKVQGTRNKEQSGESKLLPLDGVFVHIGMIPQSEFVSIVEKEPSKKIIVDKLCRTNVPGLFAAGDVTDVPYQQIAIATGQGVIAALTAIDYLNKLPHTGGST